MTDPTSDLRLLVPDEVRLRLDSFARLWVRIGIEPEVGPVEAFRALPLTQPERFISLQELDGTEVGMISDVRDLESASRAALERDLELYYLKARVNGIKKVESKNGLISWDLVTDLGEKRIHVRDRQQIRQLPNGKTVLTDIHGGKYEIPPMEELDEQSRRFLAVEL